MRIEIISIGDELLIGQTINTNAAWIGAELARRGASVEFCTVIKDGSEVIKTALDLALSRVDVVIITGGLGPTQDDITKETLAEYFNTELVINEEVLRHVKAFFEARGRTMLDINIQQAALPKSAIVLKNNLGTASGMWFEKEDKVVISLPGVPYEMKHILADSGFDMLINKYGGKELYNETMQIQGIGESYLADRIKDIETEIRNNNIGLAYLPSPGLVRLRLTGGSNEQDKIKISSYINRITERLPQYVFGKGDDTLSKIVGEILNKKSMTLGTVESCTGGAIGKEVIGTPGASDYFLGGIISYANEIKRDLVEVDENLLETRGAVSEAVVSQMAKNGREKLKVDYCLATSGIAGPDGGSVDKPVGLVWIAIAGPEGVKTKRFHFGGDRSRNIQITVLTALNLLRCELLKINIEKS